MIEVRVRIAREHAHAAVVGKGCGRAEREGDGDDRANVRNVVAAVHDFLLYRDSRVGGGLAIVTVVLDRPMPGGALDRGFVCEMRIACPARPTTGSRYATGNNVAASAVANAITACSSPASARALANAIALRRC